MKKYSTARSGTKQVFQGMEVLLCFLTEQRVGQSEFGKEWSSGVHGVHDSGFTLIITSF